MSGKRWEQSESTEHPNIWDHKNPNPSHARGPKSQQDRAWGSKHPLLCACKK